MGDCLLIATIPLREVRDDIYTAGIPAEHEPLRGWLGGVDNLPKRGSGPEYDEG